MDSNIDNNTSITVADNSTLAPIAPPPVDSAGWTSLIPMLLIFVVFYFLMLRPQEKRRRLQESLVSGVKRGEEVMTNSGLFGVVTSINDSDNTIMVQIAKDVEIKILKSSIADIVSRSKKTEDNKDKKQIADNILSSKKNKKK